MAMAVNCIDLVIGTACRGSDGGDWIYMGKVPCPPDETGVIGTYYKFSRVPPVAGFGGDITGTRYYMGSADVLYTHHNGVEVGGGARSIKGL